MAPGAPQEPNEHETQHGNPILPSREPPKSPLEAILGPPGSLLAPPGSLLGSILASRGAHFGGFGISFLRLPYKVRNLMIFTDCWKLFSDDFCVWFLCLAGGAGASAHLEKQQMAWKVLHFPHVGHFRAEAKK